MKKILTIILLMVSLSASAVEQKQLASTYIGTTNNCDIYNVEINWIVHIYLSKCHDVKDSSVETTGKSPVNNSTTMDKQ